MDVSSYEQGGDRIAPDVVVEFEVVGRVNFASSQNGVAVLKRAIVKNRGDEPIEDVTVLLQSHPPLFRPRTWRIDRIEAQDEISLRDLETPLDSALLGGLTEAEIGKLTLTVSSGEETQFTEEHSIDMLARDEWGGLHDMAQLLAAFVSPNDPVVPGILKEASRLLEASGQSGDIEGYQSGDPRRVWMLAGAIWSALTGLGLSYAVPPASFEQEGQKIRGPARIKEEGLATCLDSTLLLAACYEAAGLNAVVLIKEGHSWTGVWLTDRDFGSVTEPDVMTVRKSADAREFVMVETTLLTKRPSVGFEAAADMGRSHIDERNEHQFEVAVDINRARAARIRPLASHRPPEEGADDLDDLVSPAVLPKPLDLGLLPGETIEVEPTTPAGRIERWQRKLLDLSLRNRLLNFRDSKQTLPFLCPDIPALEDQLADGKGFKALSLKDEDPLGTRSLLADEERALYAELASDAFSKGQIAVPLAGKDMESRLLELYRRSRSDLQEGGTNTLFLAAGFLRWKKSREDERSYRAPLLLIPVKLNRRSVKSDFVIEHHEDDVRFNLTLLEFLKRDFDLKIPELEGELPRDQSGIDLPLIFRLLRQRIQDVPGFEVVEELALSTFSFAKYLMWKDLVDRTDSLRHSTLLRHIIDNPTTPFLTDDAPGMPRPSDVDRRLPPESLFTPLPADSSQLAAVLAGQEGHDFVLIGPPGTGKSQTITNLIAQCLAVGKTVLFVAEKAAALDVVHRRLSAHGLGDAVLELHSNKSDRKLVLNQLGRSWERASRATTSEWETVTTGLRLRRDQLNAYVEALHRKGSQGFSVFEAIGRVAKVTELGFALDFGDMNSHDAESYRRLKDLAEEAGRCHEIVGEMPALDLVGAEDWSYGWEARLLEQAKTLKNAGADLLEAATDLRAEAGLSQDRDGDMGRLEDLSQLDTIASEGPDVSWALGRDREQLRKAYSALTEFLERHRTCQKSLSGNYPLDRLNSIPLDSINADWRVAQTKFWPMSGTAKAKVRKHLQTYSKNRSADPETDIAALSRLREIRGEIDELELKGCPAFKGADTDLATIGAWITSAEALLSVLRALEPEVDDRSIWEQFARALAERSDGPLRSKIRSFVLARNTWRTAAKAFAETAERDLSGLSLADLSMGLTAIEAQKARLMDWSRWSAARKQAETAGLAPLVVALAENHLSVPAGEAFERAYMAWWLPLAMDASNELRRFAHWDHEDAIAKFRQLDTRVTELAADQVLHRIQHGLPAKDSVPRASELGALRHQLGLQRPSKPIRTLISEMPDAFTKLAPCVLMSPLSVAQYLPAGQAAFDVVIFDEASQITTWDAIGAIARGHQAIIVGDPKQLPPTNFFGRTDDEEDDLPETERDLASILDEVSAAGVPVQQLDWHYRSKDESLIAFSNWHYYGGRLVTFPSPATESKAVRLHQIDGTYGRGQGRTNEDEARAIVRMIVAKLKEWLALPADERLTLGVITFNVEQQGLILDLLDEERRKEPSLEWFFEDDREEPLIVKNLENIQGDERDVMLFSITFGPDHAGKMSMAFGAMNGLGGEKRLNVAITRARRELHVFASVHAEQIDLSRTKSIGVRHLKAFLDFAARGAEALPAQDDGSLGPVDNAFEAAVKSAVEAYGWELRPQIGVSGFRIDLGVVHPEYAGAYLAGIECDGAAYHGSSTARDRDKIRQAVLEGLGWKILRIWSTDWFRNPGAVAERMHESLTALLEEDRDLRASKEAEVAPPTEEAQPVVLPVETIASPVHSGVASVSETFNEELIEDGATRDDDGAVRDVGTARLPLTANNVSATATTSDAQPPAESVRQQADAERFFDGDYSETLAKMIVEIVVEEGPLPLALLGRRISTLHGWQRTGRRIAERIQRCLLHVECHDEGETTFVWSRGGHATRVPFRHNLDRSIRETSRAEIADLIDRNETRITLSDDPELELARLAGIARLSADARSYLASCIEWWRTNEN